MVEMNSQERRHSQRVEGRYFAKYRYYDPIENHLDLQEHEAATLDISRTGVALVTEKRVPTGAHLLIKFSIKKHAGDGGENYRRIIVFTGMVVYSAPLGEHHFRIGIYFGPAQKQNDKRFIEVLSSPCSSMESYRKKFAPTTLHVGA